MAAWESDRGSSSDTEILIIVGPFASADGSTTINGMSSPLPTIICPVTLNDGQSNPARHAGKRLSTGYLLDGDTGDGLIINQDNVIVSGIQATGNRGIFHTYGSDFILIDSIAYDTANRNIYLDPSSGNYIVLNCIGLNAGDQGIYCRRQSSACYIYNTCVVNAVVNGKAAFYINYAGVTVNLKNCYADGDTGYLAANGTMNLTTCHASDASGDTQTAFATGSGAYFTNVTAGSEDLAIGADSALIDNGTDLSADTYWVHPDGDVDIIGAARPSSEWDVGAFEYVAAGGNIQVAPSDSQHAHLAGEASLTVERTISPSDSAHAHLSGEAALSVERTVSPSDSVHAHVADPVSVEVSGTFNVAPSASAHSHIAEPVQLTVERTVSPSASQHAHTASEASVTVSRTVAPSDSVHAHTAQEASATSAKQIAPSDSAHAHLAAEALVNIAWKVAPSDSGHALTSDGSPATVTWKVGPSGSIHAHLAEEASAALAGIFNIAPSDSSHAQLAASCVIALTAHETPREKLSTEMTIKAYSRMDTWLLRRSYGPKLTIK